MNKAMLIDKIAQDADITKSAAALAVESLVEGISGSLKNTPIKPSARSQASPMPSMFESV